MLSQHQDKKSPTTCKHKSGDKWDGEGCSTDSLSADSISEELRVRAIESASNSSGTVESKVLCKHQPGDKWEDGCCTSGLADGGSSA